MVDIERFDQNPNLPLFNGLIGNAPEEILQTEIGEKEKIKIVMQIVGKENLTPKIMKTLSQMNKTIVGRPHSAIFSK